jgi:hypothetical protein
MLPYLPHACPKQGKGDGDVGQPQLLAPEPPFSALARILTG